MGQENTLGRDRKKMMAQGLIRENMVDAYVDLIAQFLHKAFCINPRKNPAREGRPWRVSTFREGQPLACP
jgi:hypothetical protein